MNRKVIADWSLFLRKISKTGIGLQVAFRSISDAVCSINAY